VNWEDIVYAAVVILVIAGLLGIGYRRDKRSRDALREFAKRHGLEFHEEQPFKLISAHGEGQYQGKDLYVGYTWVKDFTPGIGPAPGGQSIAVVALTIGSTARIDRQAPVVRQFLEGTGTLSEKAVCYSFPQRRIKPITLEELEAAFSRVREVAATETR
jgi:hypothetical protein